MLQIIISARSMLAMSLAVLLIVVSFTNSDRPAIAEEKPYTGTVLDQVDLGHLPEGERVLKMTLVEMQPGAEIPAHMHKGPGLRYVLEGAIGIAWKDRDMETFEAGSTYYEGAGENHPPEEMSAKNMADGMTRVLIVELLPKE